MNVISPTPALRILVVDDSATSRAVIEKQLRKLGCNVVLAQDGASGLDALTSEEYDLVLLDCQMPDMSGYEVATQYRVQERKKGNNNDHDNDDGNDNDKERARTPIIAISAETDAAHTRLCLDSGMDGVLGKPLPIDALKKMLSWWCGRDATSVPPTKQEEMRNAELTMLFRSTSLDDFNTMQTWASQADLYMVGRLAHRMKGAALTMAAAPIVATLERIEALTIDRTQRTVDLSLELDMLREQLHMI